ncbi:hypothetical protein G8770_02270 [Aestuariicella hydrocarbonica]|uniref:Alpha-glucosidase n=1 Tax=Pseudomaricurvus hydrocarbonicus TaxID=1470433 RepID=A0A9E5MLE9_9GAMM|nr:TIM-barrel domain-containing protein [Aestuariicella hydrocarbonica]NHO64373.1 hypothetical protein [Aestuariicella hydrocarbonica]
MIPFSFRRITHFLLLAAVCLLTACEPETRERGLEAVYDAKRYRISLENQQIRVFDHQRQQDIFSSSVATLLSARKTQLAFTEAQGIFKHQATPQHACTDINIDKAEPSSHFLLLAGEFQSPGCTLRFSLRFEQKDGQLLINAATTDPSYNHLVLGFDAAIHESISGFGAQVSHQDFKGLNVPVWIQAQGIGRGSQPLSTLVNAARPGASGNDLSSDFTVPYFLSSEGYGLFLETSELSRFDFRNPHRTRIHSYSHTLKARLISCNRLLACISSYSQFTGRMANLPAWTQQGAIVGLQGGHALTLQRYNQLKALDTPISGVMIADWIEPQATQGATALPAWSLSPKDSPQWEALIAQLKSDEVRLLGYYTPYLAEPEPAISGPTENGPIETDQPATQLVATSPAAIKTAASIPSEATRMTLFQEALEQNYFVLNPQGKPYRVTVSGVSARLIDLSNPDAFTWLKNLIKASVTTHQFSGWLADYGERLPTDAVLHNGQSPLSFHNLYAQEWARLNAEVITELELQQEAVFFMRSGFSQSPAFTPLFLLSRQNTSWDAEDGLQSVIVGLFNSGMSGQSLSHATIGGDTSLRQPVSGLSRWLLPEHLTLTETANTDQSPGKLTTYFTLRRTPDLLQRWIEISAFTGLFRTAQGLTPAINAQVFDSEELGQHFAHNARLFKALAPYRKLLIEEAEEQGWPLVRNPRLHFPDELYFQRMSNADLQFMLGDSIMVAPMLTPRNQRTQRQVFLPQGEWIELASGQTITAGPKGTRLYLTPAVGQAPAYLRNNKRTREVIIPALQEAQLLQP